MVVPLSTRTASPGCKTEMSPGLAPSPTDISPTDECGLCDDDVSAAWRRARGCSTVVLGDGHYADSQRGSTVFVTIYITLVHAIFYMLERRNVQR